MTEFDTSNGTPEIFNKFIDSLLQLVGDYTDDSITREFQQIKEQRERFLSEKWTEGTEQVSSMNFREIDFDHLVTLLRNKLSTNTPEFANLHIEFIRICIQFGEYEKAEKLLKFIEQVVSADEKSIYAKVYSQWARLMFVSNEMKQSEEYYEKALHLYQQTNNVESVIKTFNNLGITAFEQWKMRTGENYFIHARELLSKFDGEISSIVNIKIQMNLGIIEGIQGNYSKAIEYFDPLIEELSGNMNPGLVNILVNKGLVLNEMKNYEEALSVYDRAYKGARELGNVRLLGLAARGLAETFVRKNQLEPGELKTVEAFEIFSKLGDRVGIADTYEVFGLLHQAKENYELASSYFDMSLNINKEYNNLYSLAKTYYDYSQLVKNLGDTESQKVYLQQCMHYAEQMDATHRAEHVANELAVLS